MLWSHLACQKPLPPQEPTAAVISTQEDVASLWESALSVLRKFEFVPDRQDRAVGVITTLPMTSMQWHEPWRQDVVDGYHLLESSLHTTQRVVTVRFHSGEQPHVDVQVDVYRASQPETQITSASSVLHGFAGLLPTETGVLATAAQVDWVPLGRDAALEDRILRRILNFSQYPVPESDVQEAPGSADSTATAAVNDPA